MAKDSRYFKHDSNSRHDPKIKSLINKVGICGYAYFWIIIEMLREASGYRLEDKHFVWETIAEETRLSVEKAKEFVNDCVERELFIRDDGFFYSNALILRMQDLNDIRNKRSAAGKLGMESRWGKDE